MFPYMHPPTSPSSTAAACSYAKSRPESTGLHSAESVERKRNHKPLLLVCMMLCVVCQHQQGNTALWLPFEFVRSVRALPPPIRPPSLAWGVERSGLFPKPELLTHLNRRDISSLLPNSAIFNLYPLVEYIRIGTP
jgi:hypothetical protein